MIHLLSKKALYNLRKCGAISFTDEQLDDCEKNFKPIVHNGEEIYIDAYAMIHHSKERCDELARKCWDMWRKALHGKTR